MAHMIELNDPDWHIKFPPEGAGAAWNMEENATVPAAVVTPPPSHLQPELDFAGGSPAERAADLQRWAASHERGPGLPDTAIGRDAIYD